LVEIVLEVAEVGHDLRNADRTGIVDYSVDQYSSSKGVSLWIQAWEDQWCYDGRSKGVALRPSDMAKDSEEAANDGERELYGGPEAWSWRGGDDDGGVATVI
jgi:hypothetical protein